MINLSDIIAGVALALGLLNFYWQFLHKKKSLHLVALEDFNGKLDPRFAVVNGGDDRVLITKLELLFAKDNGRSKYLHPYILNFEGSKELLIDSGAGVDFTVTYLSPLSTSYALSGQELKTSSSGIYFHDVHVEITWVEMSGEVHSRSVKMYQLGFRPDGTLAARVAVEKRTPLYPVSVNFQKWAISGSILIGMSAVVACFFRATAGFEARIPPGCRAAALIIPSYEARLVRPGNYVDILVDDRGNALGDSSATTLLQNVPVLRSEYIDINRGLLLVAVNPLEAQELVLGDVSKNLHITVRPKSDNAVQPMERVEARRLFKKGKVSNHRLDQPTAQ